MATKLPWALPSAQLINEVFQPALAQQILKLDKIAPHTERALWDHILDLLRPLVGFQILHNPPQGIAHFLTVMDPVLSNLTKEQITRNQKSFDAMAGAPLANIFICELSIERWLCGLFDQIVHCDRSLRNNRQVSTSTMTSTTTVLSNSFSAGSSNSRLTSAGSGLHPIKPMPQYDGPMDEGKPEHRIIQVSLHGPNIISAWKRNTTVVDHRFRSHPTTLRRLDSFFSLGPTESPVNPGGFPVFHGTWSHHEPDGANWPDMWRNERLNLIAANRDTQVLPKWMAGIYTSFSSMRSFLWAAYHGEWYKNIPSSNELDVMNRLWTSQGQTFRGVAVFAFDINVPSPGGNLTHVVLQKAQSDALVKNGRNVSRSTSMSADDAWLQLATAHGSLLETWPNVLHCTEDEHQSDLLRPFGVNPWRTVWNGEGVDHLNKCYKFTMAIDLKITPELPPQIRTMPSTTAGPAPKKDDDGDGKQEAYQEA